MSTEILSAALGGLAGWVLISAVGFLVRRNRLQHYVAVCFNTHFDNVRDSDGWLRRMTADGLAVGQRVAGAPFYTRDALEDLASVRERALELLSRREMLAFTKCFNALWEVEALLEGFAKTLLELQKGQQPLTAADVSSLHKRARRIHALVGVMPQQITSLAELPTDYRGRIAAETLVPDPSPSHAVV